MRDWGPSGTLPNVGYFILWFCIFDFLFYCCDFFYFFFTILFYFILYFFLFIFLFSFYFFPFFLLVTFFTCLTFFIFIFTFLAFCFIVTHHHMTFSVPKRNTGKCFVLLSGGPDLSPTTQWRFLYLRETQANVLFCWVEDLIGKNLCANKIFASNNLGTEDWQFGSKFLILNLV